ncbi:MAG: hypothetical protein ACE5JB_01555 [bacterium]
MKKLSKFLLLSVSTLFVLSSFSLIGCTKHPSTEQLQALDEQKNAALSAENTLEERRQEKSKQESELNKKKKELQDTKKELEEVKKRIVE